MLEEVLTATMSYNFISENFLGIMVIFVESGIRGIILFPWEMKVTLWPCLREEVIKESDGMLVYN